MADPNNSTLLKLLAHFSPFDKVDEQVLKPLANDIELRTAKNGFCLFESGDYDADEYYLIKGSVKQQASDGRESTIESGQPNARFPIARLRPRMYTAKAASDIEYFVISASVLDELQRSIRDSNPELMVQEMQQRAGEEGHALVYEFQQELKNGRFVLPSLPEVALKIRELMEGRDFDMADLAKLVNTDPAIAAKLVKVSNSALYRGVTHCDDTLAAISRLGLVTTKQLVTSFAILGLFRAKSHLFKDRMKVLWKESVEIAAYSYVLAKHMPEFNEEEALLAGLIHSVGEIVVLTYAERFYDLSTEEQTLNATTECLRGTIGEMVLSEWGFADDLVTVARDWPDWERDSEAEFDYCDLVQVAILYSFKSNPGSFDIPEMSDVPAFNKLAGQQLGSEQISRIITQAQEQIAELRSIFS
jgi:HD-like signal output (HDOD) protein